MAKSKQKEERFFLSQDDSCHWYIVPLSKQKELEKDPDESGDAPEWAKPVGGSLRLVTFSNYDIGN